MISFYNVHSRTQAKIFRENLIENPIALSLAALESRPFRSFNNLTFSSRILAQETGGNKSRNCLRTIDGGNNEAFVRYLEQEGAAIALDLFPNLPNAGRRGTGEAVRGNDFDLLLAETKKFDTKWSDAVCERRATTIVKAAWNLFSCLYPWQPAQRRDADLRRAMKSAVGVRACEFRKIIAGPRSACDGTIQAAHIKPYARGGTDRAWNGVWLCKKHHKATEGRLRGRRVASNLRRVSIRFET